jgi:hypothetical protein
MTVRNDAIIRQHLVSCHVAESRTVMQLGG